MPPSYSLFGKVVKGLDILAAMEKVPTGRNDRPVEDLVIDRIEITEAE